MGVIQYSDEYWMEQALEQAKIAYQKDEVPVGAVLVDDQNQLIFAYHNNPITSCDPTAHAEINVLREAAKKLNNYRVINTTLYVTLEPCSMCVGALVHARIKRLVYGAKEAKTGAIESQFQLLAANKHNHTIEVASGVLAEPCAQIMSQFFKQKRVKQKGEKNEI